MFLVLEELKRLGRDWTSFLFMSGFEVYAVTPKRVPKLRDISSPIVAEQLEPMSMETKPLQNIDTPKATPAK